MRTLTTLVVLAMAGLGAAEPIERNLETTANPSIAIDNKKGSITIVGWDEPAVRVTGTVGNDVTRVDIDDDRDNPEIEVVSSKWKSRDAEAKLTIYVPRGASLDVETVSAPVTVNGASGEALELETTSGSVEVDGGFRDTRIEGVSGGIRLMNATGNVRIANVSGKVEVEGDVNDLEIGLVSGGIETDVRASTLQAESVSGSMRLGGHIVDELQVESVSGSVRFSGTLGPDADMEIHVLSGTVTVEFDEPAYGEYDLTTFSGGITVDLEPLEDLQRDNKRMEFEYGDGDRSIELESFSGSLSVR